MKPLAIIPYRTGSKRLPNKNSEQIGGMSLVHWALHTAWLSEVFSPDHIVINTDDEARVSMNKLGMPLHHVQLRPPHLATDEAQMMDVVRDAIARKPITKWEWDSLVLLQPTSPLRLPQDIAACLKALERGADAAITVKEVEWPELYTMGHAGRLRRYQAAEHARMVFPNGAVFATTRSVLESGKDWWTADVVEAVLMPPERSVDIDTIYDLEEARWLWSMRTL